jgi:hypothetical protein
METRTAAGDEVTARDDLPTGWRDDRAHIGSCSRPTLGWWRTVADQEPSPA